MPENINTVNYWNKRFERDWEKLSLMPDWLFGCVSTFSGDNMFGV